MTELKKRLDYNPETGVFTWIKPLARRLNGGDVAGGDCGHGYIKLTCGGNTYYAHRLAWWWVYGSWPNGHIDHINGNKSDNRIANLRQATVSQNMANAPLQRNNSTGLKGVYVCATTGRYRAQIMVKRKSIKLGRFETAEQAHDAYIRAAEKYFGTFARAS